MNTLYRKNSVHPITQPLLLSDQLSLLLPATILTLTSSLSQEDKQILTYLISCNSSNNFSNNLRNCSSTTDHHNDDNVETCYCFNCYMSYWVKWDSSPNHQLIHEIIDAFEDMGLKKKKGKNKKQRRNNKNRGDCSVLKKNSEICEFECLEKNSRSCFDGDREVEKGSHVRRFVSFLGGSIWNVWHI